MMMMMMMMMVVVVVTMTVMKQCTMQASEAAGTHTSQEQHQGFQAVPAAPPQSAFQFLHAIITAYTGIQRYENVNSTHLLRHN
jgi:hypothetical protein